MAARIVKKEMGGVQMMTGRGRIRAISSGVTSAWYAIASTP